jgi:uncharacterized protein (TIGR03083 family)
VSDFGALYREHVADVSALAADLSDEQLAVVVPATPDWTVRKVFCHMAGGANDQLTDRMDDAPGPAWTARHVGERADLPLADVIAELRANQDSVAASLEGNPFPAAAFDISVHHADLHEALGKPRLAEHLWRPVLDAMRPRLDPALFEAAPDYEVYRGLFSRRSRAQMLAWGTALTAEELDGMTVFGPREDDQPIPA